jgi:hypothetical protein
MNQFSPSGPVLFQMHFNIILPSPLSLLKWSLPSGVCCMLHLSSLSCLLRALLVSFPLIWLEQQYLVYSKNCEAPRHSVFFNLLLLCFLRSRYSQDSVLIYCCCRQLLQQTKKPLKWSGTILRLAGGKRNGWMKNVSSLLSKKVSLEILDTEQLWLDCRCICPPTCVSLLVFLAETRADKCHTTPALALRQFTQYGPLRCTPRGERCLAVSFRALYYEFLRL